MNIRACARTHELRNALRLGHWPQACTDDLRAHVAHCSSCSDLVLVTQHLQQARSQAMPAAPVASANLLWLRAQARRRQTAMERAARPLAIAQLFALAVGVLAAVVLVAIQLRGAFSAHPLRAVQSPLASFSSLVASGWDAELVGAALLLLLAGLALFLTSEHREKFGR